MDDILLCERKYEGDKLIESKQVSYFTRVGDPSILKKYTFFYFPISSKIKTIKVDEDWGIEYLYDEEEPNQLKSVAGFPVIYNLEGKLIEINKSEDEVLRFTYNSQGLLSNIVNSVNEAGGTLDWQAKYV